MAAGFGRAFEDLLQGRGSAWRVVGGNRERLIAACIDYLTPERVSAWDFENPGPMRATWILDLLLPLDEVELFRRLNGYERWLHTLYALFRRSAADLDSVTPERFGRGEAIAVEAAWTETRETNDELLGWQAECARRGWPNGDRNKVAVIEYCRRTPDLDRITRYLPNAPHQEAPVLLHCAMQLVAGSVPRTDAPETGLVDRLKMAGFDELGEAAAGWMSLPPSDVPLVVEFPTRMPSDLALWESGFAKTLWMAQQTSEDVDRVADSGISGAAWILPRIVPRDRVKVWERAFESNRHHDPSLMHAFCGWCRQANRHLLVRHFEHEDTKWAASALETYLGLATPAEVARLAESKGRPAWQLELIDRWIHAPAELRPVRRRLRCRWETVFDYREFDPFDVRR